MSTPCIRAVELREPGWGDLATTRANSRELSPLKTKFELPVCDLLRAFSEQGSTLFCPPVRVGRLRDAEVPIRSGRCERRLPKLSELPKPPLTYRAGMADLRTSQRTPLRCTECARRRVRCNKKVPCAECILRHQSHKCTREVVRVRGKPTV